LTDADHGWWAHDTAVVDDGAVIGKGTRIWHFSHVMGGARIGAGCSLGQNVFVAAGAVLGANVKVQNNVSIYAGVELGDDVFCGPSMVFTNVVNPRSHVSRKDEYRPTRVGDGATFGANSTVICGHAIGRYAFIAAGAVVASDVPDHALVVGVPGRVVGHVCVCGVRLPPVAKAPDGSVCCDACGESMHWDGAALTRVIAPFAGPAERYA
jgi:UDP-2-acetamido-3-amino-2,3-dideoxy-glucuronate N-acetyltransferase